MKFSSAQIKAFVSDSPTKNGLGDVITEWKVTPNWIARYTYIHGAIPENCRPTANKVKGELSAKAVRRLKQCINWLVYLSKPKRIYMKELNKYFTFKINFITLTLSSAQCHSDREIKRRLLEPFLKVMRNKWKVVNYVWKAETQANGNIHFHITADKFIHHAELRLVWNTIQENLGYVSRSNIADPNSTDIHAVKQVRNLAAYISKYISKNDSTRRKIEGKIWDCNRALKSISVKSRREDVMKLVEQQIVNQGGEYIGERYMGLYFLGEGQLNKLCIGKQVRTLVESHCNS